MISKNDMEGGQWKEGTWNKERAWKEGWKEIQGTRKEAFILSLLPST